jgi:hypothetical protein
MDLRPRVIATACALPLAFSACGDSGSAGAPKSNRLALSASKAPTAAQCGFAGRGSPGRVAASSRAPAPGSYSYATTARETVPGQGGTRPLPARSDSVITPTRLRGNLVCFGALRRYSSPTRTADVYLRRGDDIYLVALGFDTPSFVLTVLPRPAILALSGSSTTWSGGFTGRTRGSYRVEIVGRRTFKIGNKLVKAVGVRSSAAFRGEADGTQRGVTWLAIARPLVVAESGRSVLRFGGDEERLSFSSRLLSLTPGAGGG